MGEIILIEERTAKDFTAKINELRAKGYEPINSFTKQDGFFYQMVELKKMSLETKEDYRNLPNLR